MQFRKATLNDSLWIYEVLSVLRNPVIISYEMFLDYFKNTIEDANSQFLIFEVDHEKVGYVTLNFTQMPRYIGLCAEIEEFVVEKQFRRKGYGLKMLDVLISHLRENKNLRKLIVKSSGSDSIAMYEKLMQHTELHTLQIYLNKV